MAPAVVEGLALAAKETYAQPHQAFYAARQAIKGCLEGANMLHDGVLIERTVETTHLLPRNYVNTLIDAACGDAEDIMSHSAAFVATEPPADGSTFTDLLKRSKQPLLKSARLRDDRLDQPGDKGAFHDALLFTRARSGALFGETLPTLLEYAASQHGRARLAWQPSVANWLERRTSLSAHRGCPAAKHVLEQDDGSRQTLLHYFWDELVDLAYPEKQTI